MKLALIVGCPRSGTSWLQMLLAQHPHVATTQETHLFDGYLRHLGRAWERFKSLPDEAGSSHMGMTQLFSDAEFDALCGDFAAKVFHRIAETNPAASVVLEKTPDHVADGPLILRLFPDAYFIHIVRDPRSVVSSLVSVAERSWGERWASSSVVHNARLWRTNVARGREISRLTTHYREVRYEDLLGPSGAEVLGSLFSWLDLPADRAFAQAALTTCHIDRLRQGGQGVRAYDSLKRPESEFFRKGQSDGWRSDLPPKAISIIEYIDWDLLKESGYSSATAAATRPAKPFRLSVHEMLERVERRTGKGVGKVFKKARSVI